MLCLSSVCCYVCVACGLKYVFVVVCWLCCFMLSVLCRCCVVCVSRFALCVFIVVFLLFSCLCVSVCFVLYVVVCCCCVCLGLQWSFVVVCGVFSLCVLVSVALV